ncbi:MAG: S-adenosylmethionine:tRNA ribosyltransferase-isomerase [Dehalococcoidia bacterium]|nr:S-adenosylmethionine:tRNA ribosyltransferase-isomerase [Dehalococcoidia bacterium]
MAKRRSEPDATADVARLDFTVPDDLVASEPPEARGLARNGVRLLVSHRSNDAITHTTFGAFADFLDPGDLVVVNTSATINAALPVWDQDGARLELHLSNHLDDDRWLVEVRGVTTKGSEPCFAARAGVLALPGGGRAILIEPHSPANASGGVRLWKASVSLPLPALEYADAHGFPIRYGYVPVAWPLTAYQNVYSREPGSAEMASAGRGFTAELVTELVARGVQVAPIVLHTGVSSLEEHELPYAEYYRVPSPTARLVNVAREDGRRVVAVGTTVVRALESATSPAGLTRRDEGWTDLVIMPSDRLAAVTAIVSGFHEPRASHLAMLNAVASIGATPERGRRHLAAVYRAALEQRYLWHEFGDLHLLMD